MRNHRFEWDDDKARANFAKHKISFEAGCLVFDDPDLVEMIDPHPEEQRFRATGLAAGRLVTVVYTERFPRLRIISVRKATRHEQKAYDTEI